jgi:uncharacterized protein YecE (DUF72 family)
MCAIVRITFSMHRIGISGWTYKGWRGVFYPKDLPQSLELVHASQVFNSIEINGTHYSLQRPSSFTRWRRETPDDFVFSIKGGRFITHMKKLRDVDDALANFYASGVLALGKKTGPFLWQLPPNLGFDADRMRRFFELLPRSSAEAAALAKKHTSKLKHGACTRITDGDRRLRHCVEVRHPSFLTPAFFDCLREHKIAFVFADTAGKWPYAEDLTADFVYIRLHGAEQLYVSGYSDAGLDWWANRIRFWSRSMQPPDARLITPQPRRSLKIRNVYVYFDNDAKVKAPFDAQRLRARLSQEASV